MTIRHFKKSMALLLGGLAVSLHAVGESHCSDQNASIIENAMESRLEAESRTIVWMRNNKQFELDSCLASGDGHQDGRRIRRELMAGGAAPRPCIASGIRLFSSVEYA